MKMMGADGVVGRAGKDLLLFEAEIEMIWRISRSGCCYYCCCHHHR